MFKVLHKIFKPSSIEKKASAQYTGIMATSTIFDSISSPEFIAKHLSGSARSLALGQWAKNRFVCAVVPDSLSAQRLQDELQFFQREMSDAPPVLLFPDWETLPYDCFSPHQDIISERLSTLSKLKAMKTGFVIVSMPTLLHWLPPYEFIAAHSFDLSLKEKLDVEMFRKRLEQAGYLFVNKVMEHGECAIRGSIIDIYPMGSREPFRIDLLDDEIDSIRLFEVDSQRSTQKIDRIQLLPAREFPLDEKNIAQFRQAWRNRFAGNPSQCPVYNAVSDGMTPAGIEYYLPLFFENSASLLDYLPPKASTLLMDTEETLQSAQDKFLNETKLRYEQRRHDITRPLLAPESLLLTPETLKEKLNAFEVIALPFSDEGNPEDRACPVLDTGMPASERNAKRFESIASYLKQQQHILFCTQTIGRRELLNEQLRASGIHAKYYPSWKAFIESWNEDHHIGITQGLLDSGFILHTPPLSVVTEHELWGETAVQQRKTGRRTLDTETIVRDLSELHIGSPVVHIEHGIGRYLGLKNIEYDGQTNEFLTLEYAGGDKIYVPVTSLEKISRYTGADTEHVPLHRLGSDKWQKEKKKAEEKICDAAVELLEIYAQREARERQSYAAPDKEYQQFASAFPFEETPDQTQAIECIIRDLQSPRPMDRLICGDVGFGKTEVAMRACFLAVQNHKQVCVLAPTTLLAAQHYENFCDRFAEFGANIELLSRFRTTKEAQKVLDGLKNGQIDIVIGTHKLFQKTVQFARLGLLVIDEEHRFGVKQKEFIKSLRHEVDILSLTATPIPRTLNMSLSGLRDISVIATPPLKRLAIKTFCLEKDLNTIREAILREIMRGGQVFYLHNQVKSMENSLHELKKLIPEASIQIAHGQMPERQLEKIMSDFYHHRFQVLLCSTIIETGIDIPTANTIIIERADTFGLAQLHQLRGRVGRSHHQAYAYLLTPPQNTITADVVKRLDAIMSIEDLGAGFTLATHDLEIRGAGELLGEEQSGNMNAIGFSLYMELLERAVKDLKSGKTPELSKDPDSKPEIDLKISTIIPENYMADVHTRLIFYKRIAHAATEAELDDLQVEMIDRFGLLPEPVKNLFRITALKQTAQKLGIKKITASKEWGKIDFEAHPNVDPGIIIQMIQVQPKTYRLEGPSRLKFAFPEADDRILITSQVLAKLHKLPGA